MWARVDARGEEQMKHTKEFEVFIKENNVERYELSDGYIVDYHALYYLIQTIEKLKEEVKMERKQKIDFYKDNQRLQRKVKEPISVDRIEGLAAVINTELMKGSLTSVGRPDDLVTFPDMTTPIFNTGPSIEDPEALEKELINIRKRLDCIELEGLGPRDYLSVPHNLVNNINEAVKDALSSYIK